MPIELITTQAEFQKAVEKELYEVLNKNLKRVTINVERDMENTIPHIFRQTTIYKELTSGELAGHFGFPKGSEVSRVEQIITKISENVDVIYEPLTANSGGITIMVNPDIYTELMRMPAAVVVTAKGEALNWIEWLLLRGTQLIITDARIKFGNYGRSGQAIMRPGGTWSVPAQYAGTVNDNWITRVFEDSDAFIYTAFETIIQKEIERII